jgi:N-dimethylarginine dimethylaminohydrolase
MCFNLVSENLAAAYPPALPEEFLAELKRRDIEIIPGDEEAIFSHGYNLQTIGGGRVVSLKQNTALNEALDKRGFQVIETDITEILKTGGGPHCMTFPLERL